MADNKLWEGHRLMYPEMRELILEGRKETVVKPELSDDILEQLDERLRYALNFNKPLLVTYYRDKKIHESILFSFKVKGDAIQWEGGKKIKLPEIVDLKIL